MLIQSVLKEGNVGRVYQDVDTNEKYQVQREGFEIVLKDIQSTLLIEEKYSLREIINIEFVEV